MLAKLARGVARCIGDGQHVSKVQSLETGESWPEFYKKRHPRRLLLLKFTPHYCIRSGSHHIFT